LLMKLLGGGNFRRAGAAGPDSQSKDCQRVEEMESKPFPPAYLTGGGVNVPAARDYTRFAHWALDAPNIPKIEGRSNFFVFGFRV
jgi:hypothetical protein